MGTFSSSVMNLCGFIACGFLGALAATIIGLIWMGRIKLDHLLNEANGQASMSRFQLLIFTFVVAIGMFELIEKTTPAGFPQIPNGVLTLLGISASTYAVGKGISYSDPESLKAKPSDDDIAGAKQAAKDAAANAEAAKVSADKSAGHMVAAQRSAQDAADSANKA